MSKMIADGVNVKIKIYNCVWSNMSYGEIKEQLKTEHFPPTNPRDKNILGVMCGYFGMEKAKYQFWGDSTAGPPITKVGQTFKSRVTNDARFSDVLKWLEDYAINLSEGQEKRAILDYILPYHRNKMREKAVEFQKPLAKKDEMITEIKKTDLYPTQEEIERALDRISRSDGKFHLDELLNEIDRNAKMSGRVFKEDWRIITENKVIRLWGKQTEGSNENRI